MDETNEKRLTTRNPRTGRLEVLLHGRTDWCGQVTLVDCSEEGLGLEVGQRLKSGAVIVLRPAARTPSGCPMMETGAVPFTLVTAKVHWCREMPSPGGMPIYRVGVRRLLPSC